jgi:hypothetical protein
MLIVWRNELVGGRNAHSNEITESMILFVDCVVVSIAKLRVPCFLNPMCIEWRKWVSISYAKRATQDQIKENGLKFRFWLMLRVIEEDGVDSTYLNSG